MEIVGSVAGALIGGDAAGDAADTQAAAADRSTALQREMFDQTRQDQAPYRNIGYSGLNQLAMLLGLDDPTAQSETEAQLRERLLSQYSTPGTPASSQMVGGGRESDGWSVTTPGTPGTVNEDALNAAIRAQMAQQRQAATAYRNNPLFGSMNRTFTGADLQNEPGYIFGMNQGVQARDRSASANGSLYSGAQMKALNRFGQDYGGTKFNEAFNRDQTNKNTAFNRLASITGLGQTANSQIQSAGQNYANQASNNMIGAGNARAAAGIAQGNAWQNALNQGISAYGRSRQPSYGGYDDNFPPQYSAAPPYYDYGQGGYQ